MIRRMAEIEKEYGYPAMQDSGNVVIQIRIKQKYLEGHL